MENLESHGILEFHFPGREVKVIEFKFGSWKVIENGIVHNKLGRLFFVKKG